MSEDEVVLVTQALLNLRCPSPPPILTNLRLGLPRQQAENGNYIARPPSAPQHHKAPSVHAHFEARSRLRSGLEPELLLPVSENIDPRLPQNDGKMHVLLGVCGAVLALKIKMIVCKLHDVLGDRIAVQVVLTLALEHFVTKETLQQLAARARIWRDHDEWLTWLARTDPVLHIELRRWADILVVCPLTANTLTKIALGICDNLLTSVIRAWNTLYPILLAPAMGLNAYNAVTTRRQLRLVAEEMPWIEVLKPVEKVVGLYGDIGMGGMMDWNEIVNKVVLRLGGYPDAEGEGEGEGDEGEGEGEGDEGDDDDDDGDDGDDGVDDGVAEAV